MSEDKEIIEGHIQVELSSIPMIQSTESQSCVKLWMEKLGEGLLTTTHFKEHWRVWVPRVYSPEPNDNCLEWSFDEEQAQNILYDPLEEFICNGNPQEVIKHLSQLDSPPSICGRVFKNGEPTYSCRECGMDSTCVLCVDCFKQSEHRNHKYKMGTSSGGGCCDCGDTEAWKKEPFCKIHLIGNEAKDNQSCKLPQDIIDRASITFKAVLNYCFDLLSLDYSPSLPADLRLKDTDGDGVNLLSSNDNYCTVLFNDETHTFDQVIVTLTRVLKCSQRNAIEFVTNIDREGRSVVKCSGFQHCNELKLEIERFTSRHSNRPLKVLVEHAHVVAHQIFAMKLLSWLQQFISHCEGFRIIFSDVALNSDSTRDPSIVKGILHKDYQLWKAARTAWHRLFISGMLTEYESKKALAIIFTANYGTVVKDFIKDDHEHSFSIASLSVQLFTVPTLAHLLIAHHDALLILLNTFNSESSRRCNAAGKLEFERNSPNTQFKRAQFVLYDLRYLLSSVPETWTDELRRGFLHGISLLLQLFTSMQSMDTVVRQVGQHMEYEQEWESAFNLHIKLSPVISLSLEWCGSDRVVLIKAFRLLLKTLYEPPGKTVVREVAGYSAACVPYDVSTEPVSIHLPLSRFLAGLFLYLEKYDLTFESKEFQNILKPAPKDIIEPVLRAQAMVAQVNANMWRRNGYSLIHQLYFYHNVKCRTEMLDKDIILMQVGAALIESNEFLIHLLNKFNLVNWAQEDFEVGLLKTSEEDTIRQTINLAEEFLGLIITIVGERFVPGISDVTQDDCLKKEIIQQLCIKPLSHSELNKTLPDDVHHETGMERVIKDIADFKKPSASSSGKGVYELRTELYSSYNIFFYHYTKEELSKSEEAQRKKRKAAGELECCPPPKLPKLTKMFYPLIGMLQSDVMLSLLSIVLSRTLNLKARSFSEPQVHKALHLIGYALQEQESGNYSTFQFTERAAAHDIYKLLESLTTSPRIDAHKDLLTWVLNKYRQVAGSPVMDVDQNLTSAQKSEMEETEKNDKDKEWRMKMAAQKRAKIMAQMTAMQKHFIKKNAKLFEEVSIDVGKQINAGSSMDVIECVEEIPVALGKHQTTRICHEKSYVCILCQEDQCIKANESAMVLAAFVQQSTVLCQGKSGTFEPTTLFLSSGLGASPHTRTCGHVMHASCWQKYFDNVLAKENRRPYRLRQPASFDVEKHEYLCPLCECLSNTVLPVLPALGLLQPSPAEQPDLGFDQWVDLMTDCMKSCQRPPSPEADESKEDTANDCDPECRYCKPMDTESTSHQQENMSSSENVNATDSLIKSCPLKALKKHKSNCGAELLRIFSEPGPTVSDNIIEMISLFTQTTFIKGLGVDPNDRDSRIPFLAWKSTAYTVHAIEFLLRDTDKPLLGSLSSRERDSLEGLARVTAMIAPIITSKTRDISPENNIGSIAECAVQMLSGLLLENFDSKYSILSWDSFSILVNLVLALPSLLSNKSATACSTITGNVSDRHLTRLVLLAHIAKIILTSKFDSSDELMEVDDDYPQSRTDCKSILEFAHKLQVDVGPQRTAENLWCTVKRACTPFLRCCVLYFHYVTDVPAPVSLTLRGGDTFENMCNYLGLPETCEKLLGDCPLKILEFANMWSRHPQLEADRVKAPQEPLKINRLIELPDDYSELMNRVSHFICPNSDKEDSRNPTICLVCGDILCSQSYCCQAELNKTLVGACTYHANECGAGVGVFLRVRDCEIVFLRSPNRGCYICPPYFDEYGETDQGLHRGNPLKLCKERYQRLNQMWLGHGLFEAIARALETTNAVSGQWQHL